MKVVGFLGSVDMCVGGRREVKVVVRMHEYCVSEAGGIRRNFRKSAFYENLTRCHWPAVLLVENSLDVPRSTHSHLERVESR